MKVLVATFDTQGQRDTDFFFAEDTGLEWTGLVSELLRKCIISISRK